jgi:hypothetical protein
MWFWLGPQNIKLKCKKILKWVTWNWDFTVLYTASYCHTRKAELKGDSAHTFHQDTYKTQSLLSKISTHSSHSFPLCKLVLNYTPTSFTKQFCTGKTQKIIVCGQPLEGRRSIPFGICVCNNLDGCLVFGVVTTKNPIQKFCYRQQHQWFGIIWHYKGSTKTC